MRVTGIAAAHRGAPPADTAPGVPVVHAPLPRRVLYDAWNTAGLPRAEHLVRTADVVHATTWAVPPTRRPLVVTVHDLAYVRDPGHFTPRGVRFFTRSFERVRAEADVVVVPSEATAADCVEAGLERDRVVVVPHGVRVGDPGPAGVAAFRARHGLTRPYVLWTGTREPRKNLTGLLAAWSLVAAEVADLDLVLVGPAGWGDAEPAATSGTAGTSGAAGPAGATWADGAGGPGERVHALGRLDWDELQAAYAGAAAFCYPSLWEGFGMPVLEAMAHGVPVVTSAGTSMAEVVGETGVLVAPTEPSAVAAGLLRALSDPGLGAAGRARAHGFTWQAVASTMHAVYERARGAR